MGLRHGFRDAKDRREEARVKRFVGQLGPSSYQAAERSWATLMQILGVDWCRFFAAKWRLDDGYFKPGDIARRPRSAEEIADALDMKLDLVRQIDSAMVNAIGDTFMRSEDWGNLITVPVDEAQNWWDKQYGNSFLPDGWLIPSPAQDFAMSRLKRSGVKAAIARAGLSSEIADAVLDEWARLSRVTVRVAGGSPGLSCHAHGRRVAERLVAVLKESGADAEFRADTGSVYASLRLQPKP